MRAMHDASEAGIGKQRRSSREIGAGHRTVAVTATVWVGRGVTFAITFASDIVAGEFTHHILIAVVVMAVVPVSTTFADRVLGMVGHSQMQMNAEGRHQCRQDRHC